MLSRFNLYLLFLALFWNLNYCFSAEETSLYGGKTRIRIRSLDDVVPTMVEVKHKLNLNRAVVGIVEKISGPSFVQHPDSSAKSTTSVGLRAFEGDKFYTSRSRIHIRYKDGTYIEMGSDSEFGLEKMRFKAPNQISVNKASDQFDESVFRFGQGIVRITAPDVHATEHFVVKTSHAIIKATGPTDFYLIQLAGERDLTIKVSRGKIQLMNAITNEWMDVPANSGAYLKISGLVNSAGSFNEDQLNFLKQRTRI